MQEVVMLMDLQTSTLPEGTQSFVVNCDASKVGLGCILMQNGKVTLYLGCIFMFSVCVFKIALRLFELMALFWV